MDASAYKMYHFYASNMTISKRRQLHGFIHFGEHVFRPRGRGEETEEQVLALEMEEFYFAL